MLALETPLSETVPKIYWLRNNLPGNQAQLHFLSYLVTSNLHFWGS